MKNIYRVAAGLFCVVILFWAWIAFNAARLHNPDYLFSLVVTRDRPAGLAILNLDREDYGLREWDALFTLSGGREQLQQLIRLRPFEKSLQETGGPIESVIMSLPKTFPNSGLTTDKLDQMECYWSFEESDGMNRYIFFDEKNNLIYYYVDRF